MYFDIEICEQMQGSVKNALNQQLCHKRSDRARSISEASQRKWVP